MVLHQSVYSTSVLRVLTVYAKLNNLQIVGIVLSSSFSLSLESSFLLKAELVHINNTYFGNSSMEIPFS